MATRTASSVRDVMTPELVTCRSFEPVVEGARLMRDRDIGDVLVMDEDQLVGIVTDRDIAVRIVAEGKDVTTTPIVEACSTPLVTVEADRSVDEAARVMADCGLRRLPVVEEGRAVGIVSLGDLAIERNPDSALGQISAEPPNS